MKLCCTKLLSEFCCHILLPIADVECGQCSPAQPRLFNNKFAVLIINCLLNIYLLLKWTNKRVKLIFLCPGVLCYLYQNYNQRFWSRWLACSTCGGGQKWSWPLFSPRFSFFLLSTPFPPTPYFGVTRRNIYKKKIKKFFLQKLTFDCFFWSLWSAFGHGSLGHPQSLEY